MHRMLCACLTAQDAATEKELLRLQTEEGGRIQVRLREGPQPPASQGSSIVCINTLSSPKSRPHVRPVQAELAAYVRGLTCESGRDLQVSSIRPVTSSAHAAEVP